MPDIDLKCKATGREFSVSQWAQDFLKKMDLPLPDLCPDERHRRRLSHRNERKIYRDTCDLTGESIISLYSDEKPFKVYSQKAWWGDEWEATDYGRDFDFSRPFFEQFYELQLVVPRLSLMNKHNQNSDYCNITVYNKNCYLVFGGDYCEDCMNSVFSMHSKDCSDVYWANHCELCYEMVDCSDCYNCKYSQNSHNCKDSSFLFECRGCSDCFGCVGLRNKQYYILNKPHTKEEYFKKLESFGMHSWSGVQKMKKGFEDFKATFPHRDAQILKCESCTGDDLISAKNCINCFDINGPAEDMEDVILGGWNISDVYSCDHVGHKGGEFYECVGSINGQRYVCCTFAWESHNIAYSDMIVNNSHDVFGCCGMKKAAYCIFNKAYSKQEYEELRAKIVAHMKETGEWGQFFPSKYSPWAYNETVAQDLFPSTKEDVQSKGLKWRDEDLKEVGEQNIPDSIHDTDESILQESFVCERTGRPFKINSRELKFYKKIGVPIPHYAQETRNEMRIAQRNPRKIWDRHCDKCRNNIQTSYSPQRPEKVYCESCYLETLN